MSEYGRYNATKLAEAMYTDGTLINKLGIHDSHKLAQIEYRHSARVSDDILKSRFRITNVRQLKDIHRAMFSDLYSWAGKIRDYDISKNGRDFLPHAAMSTAEDYINGMLRQVNSKRKPSAQDYAKLLDSINDMHPFREGNGRSTKTFLECVAIQHGQFLQYDRHEHDAIIGLNHADIPRIAKHIHVQRLVPSETLSQQVNRQRKYAQRNTLKHSKRGLASPKWQALLRKQTNRIVARRDARKRKYARWNKRNQRSMKHARHAVRRRTPERTRSHHSGPTLE